MRSNSGSVHRIIFGPEVDEIWRQFRTFCNEDQVLPAARYDTRSEVWYVPMVESVAGMSHARYC